MGVIMKKRWKRNLSVVVCILFGILFLGKGTTAQAAEIPEPYDKIEMRTLLEQKKLSVTGKNVSITDYEKGNGIMIKGKKEAVTGTDYVMAQAYDFGSTPAKYLVADGLCQKKKDVYVEFLLDGKTSIGKIKLTRQKKNDTWTNEKNYCIDVSGKNITGIHTLSYRIQTSEALEEMSVLMRSVLFTKSNLPTVVFDLDETQGTIAEMNQDLNHETECYGNMTLKVPDGYVSEYSSEVYKTETYELDYLRGRGNSTWAPDKKPYKMKLSKKADLLGMGKNKHWVLLANYYDVSMLRNKFTYWLGAKMGMEYTPQCVFADVVMNNRYLGSYYLCEQVRVGNSRVDIDDLEDTEETKYATDENIISGGYLLGMSPYADKDCVSFMTEQGMYVELESPKFEDYTNEAQLNYIKEYLQKVENAIYGDDFKDSEGHHYSEYMDLDSAVDYYLVQELSMNGDAFISPSTYMYKKRNGKLYWGPLWDFDYVAWGATEYAGNYTEGFMCTGAAWFKRLLADPVFVSKLVARWQDVRTILQQGTKEGGQIDIYSAQQYESQRANYAIWEKELFAGEGIENDITYDSEVTRLKLWINSRIQWLDENIADIKATSYKVTFMTDGEEYASQIIGNYVAFGGIVPEAPEKEGYYFDGWYQKKEIDGESYEIKMEDSTVISESMEIYAKWIDLSKVTAVEKMLFGAEDIYLDSYGYYSVPEISVFPFHAFTGELTWESDNMNIVEVYGNSAFFTGEKGTATLTVTASNNVTASVKIHVREWNVVQGLEAFSLENKVTVKQGEYTRAVVTQKSEKCFENYGYAILDESIAEVDTNGYLYGKKAGTTTLCVYSPTLKSMKVCTVVVTGKEQTVSNAVKSFSVKGLKYKVLSDGKTVKCTGMEEKDAKSVTIPAAVTYSGQKYKVTVISAKAFKNSKKLKKVVIGKNVTQIGKEAFYGCSKLETIDIRTKVLTKVGENAFAKASKKMKLTFPEGCETTYTELISSK